MRSVQPLASYIKDVAELRSAEVDPQPSRSLLQLRGPDRWPLQKFSLAVKALKSAFRNVHSPGLVWVRPVPEVKGIKGRRLGN